MLKGGNELLERAKKRLEIGQKETTQDGVFSLEEVECIGACTGAPAMQVNYDFYENRSEEHTSELQSRLHLVCRLLLEKKKTNENRHQHASVQSHMTLYTHAICI